MQLHIAAATRRIQSRSWVDSDSALYQITLVPVMTLLSVQHYKQDADGLVTHLQKPVVAKNEFIKHGWQIKQSDIKLGEQIGKGQFGGQCRHGQPCTPTLSSC